ncbi:MAG TPA: GntR family transcriptional regulator [Conexibacter sp.]
MVPRPQIDRSSPLPLWAQVLVDLQASLANGEFDERFPTDKELIERYGVSRQTVREAVRRLRDEGVIERERGRGTRVHAFRQIAGSLESLYEQVQAQGAVQRSVVRVAALVSDAEIAARLRLPSPARARLLMIERLRLADEAPLAIDRSWLPERVAEGLLDTDLSHTGIYVELMRRSNVDVDRGSESIRPVLPAPDDRRALQLPRGEAAFEIQRLAYAADRPVEWRVSIVRGDRYTITTDLTRRTSPTAARGLPWAPVVVAGGS